MVNAFSRMQYSPQLANRVGPTFGQNKKPRKFDIELLPNGDIRWGKLQADGTVNELVFTPEEWDAFLKGVRAGEFDPE
ncbi:MAG: DUF397 domain-containing protein [Vampirovibrionales bacterium]|nr:DUF397 domain-containing protein [Vampirovibrionales bacterium]